MSISPEKMTFLTANYHPVDMGLGEQRWLVCVVCAGRSAVRCRGNGVCPACQGKSAVLNDEVERERSGREI